MTIQIDMVEQKDTGPALAMGSPEALRDHSEIERVELRATVCHEGFKDALAMCGVSTMESGKACAFAIYRDDERITVSDPILSEPDPVCRFGEDVTHVWGVDTGTDDFIDPKNPKHCQLFTRSDGITPRDDVWGCIVTYPMGELGTEGLSAKDIRRPTKAWLDFFAKQDKLHPGFVTGILTSDGKRSGLLLFKKDEAAEKVDPHGWSVLGDGEAVGRDYVLGRMSDGGIAQSDVNLCCPKNRDPSRLYEKRMTDAIDKIF